MTDHFFDHDRLDVYRLSIEYVAKAFDTSRSLEGLHRHARDQWLRAAQSIPLNIAEGNGKRSLKDRARFLDIARGSALECAAIQDVLVVSGGLSRETDQELKSRLVRIVAMLTRMAMKFDGVSESPSEYNQSGDYEHEHRPVGLSTSTKNSQNKTMHRSGRSAALEMVNFLAATR
jgi:four helix bundle protein